MLYNTYWSHLKCKLYFHHFFWRASNALVCFWSLKSAAPTFCVIYYKWQASWFNFLATSNSLFRHHVSRVSLWTEAHHEYIYFNMLFSWLPYFQFQIPCVLIRPFFPFAQTVPQTHIFLSRNIFTHPVPKEDVVPLPKLLITHLQRILITQKKILICSLFSSFWNAEN
jgi:hypothetical protein